MPGLGLGLGLDVGPPSLRALLPSLVLGTLATLVLAAVLPELKAGWFTPPPGATKSESGLWIPLVSEIFAYRRPPPTADPHELLPCTDGTLAPADGTCPPDFHRAQRISGTLNSLRYFLVFLTSGLVGRLSDAYGRVPVLRVGNLAAAAPVLGLALTGGASPWAYYVPYLVGGLVSGGTFQYVAYVADFSEPGDRPRRFGIVGATVGVGLVVSPLVSRFAPTRDALFAASLSMLAVNQLLLAFLPESLPPAKRRPFPFPWGGGHTQAQAQAEAQVQGEAQAGPGRKTESLNPFSRLIPLSSSSSTGAGSIAAWLVVFVVLTTLAETGCAEIALLYMSDVLDVSSRGSSGIKDFSSEYLAATGVGVVLSQSFLLGALLKAGFGPLAMLTVSAVANAAHQLVYASLRLVPDERFAFANVPVTSLMFIGTPAVNAALSRESAHDEQGVALGALDAVRSLVGAFGPVLFSQLYSFGGSPPRDVPELPFFLGAALALGGVGVAWGPLRAALAAAAAVSGAESGSVPRGGAEETGAGAGADAESAARRGAATDATSELEEPLL